MTSRSILLPLVLAAGIACNGSGVEADAPDGTLAGTITIGPFCPVVVEGEECPPPPGTFESIRVLVYARALGDRLVAETRPDADGRFALALPSGSYRVALEHSFGLPGGPPAVHDARVEPGATTTIRFDLDTGIR